MTMVFIISGIYISFGKGFKGVVTTGQNRIELMIMMIVMMTVNDV